jgi:hypothetical protein
MSNIDNTIHKLRGLLQVLGSFVDCLENNIKSTPQKINADEVKEYCSIVLGSLNEVAELIGEIKNDTN